MSGAGLEPEGEPDLGWIDVLSAIGLAVAVLLGLFYIGLALVGLLA